MTRYVTVVFVALWDNRTWTKESIKITSNGDRTSDIRVARFAMGELLKTNGKGLFLLGPELSYTPVTGDTAGGT